MAMTEEEPLMKYDLFHRVTAFTALACAMGWGATGCQTTTSDSATRAVMLNQLASPTTAPAVPVYTAPTIVNEYDVVAVPPPPVVEVVPVRPYPAAVWVPGYWAPVPHWVWVRGRWRR
jgi:hypothetical protein